VPHRNLEEWNGMVFIRFVSLSHFRYFPSVSFCAPNVKVLAPTVLELWPVKLSFLGFLNPNCGLSSAPIVSGLVPNKVPANDYHHKKFDLYSSNRSRDIDF